MQHRTQREQYIVRMPGGLREKIKRSAQENCRSMNSEIVFHLERAISNRREDTDERAPAEQAGGL